MRYTKKQFLADVAKEAKALKKNATKGELEKIELQHLNPNDAAQCIYGLATGDCRSKRAADLIEKCCVKYFVMGDDGFNFNQGMREVSSRVNGSHVDGFKTERTVRYRTDHFSAIEAYICTPFAKKKNLIDYLKGERKDLVL